MDGLHSDSLLRYQVSFANQTILFLGNPQSCLKIYQIANPWNISFSLNENGIQRWVQVFMIKWFLSEESYYAIRSCMSWLCPRNDPQSTTVGPWVSLFKLSVSGMSCITMLSFSRLLVGTDSLWLEKMKKNRSLSSDNISISLKCTAASGYLVIRWNMTVIGSIKVIWKNFIWDWKLLDGRACALFINAWCIVALNSC